MSFLEPVFFLLGLGAAGVVVALHFIVTRQPTESLLPTVRFVPVSAVRVPTVARRPEHLLLLLLRVLLALCVGAAFARPVLTGSSRPIARVVLADVSRHAESVTEVRDSARALLDEGDVLIVFDSAARVVAGPDSIARSEDSRARGRLSPALVRALRAASELRSAADSIELVMVSPAVADEWDQATDSIRALWPGRVRLVKVRPGLDSAAIGPVVAVEAPEGDPVRVAASLTARTGADTTVRLLRGSADAADSTWAARGRRVLVRWPADTAPPGWTRRTQVDTTGAVVIGAQAVVFPFERRWRSDSVSTGTVIARWVDGEPAAIDRQVGSGCIRDVVIPVPGKGDLVLRPAFARLLDRLTAPCGEAGRDRPRIAPDLEGFAGSGPLATKASIPAPATVVPPLVPWLLGFGLLLALAELLLRHERAVSE